MKPLTLPPLPYTLNGLEPVISARIMELHHDKHHAAYVTGANAALEKLDKSRRGEMEINYREVMREFSFNFNGAILHDLFWRNMRPVEDNRDLEGEALTKIETGFGSLEAFKKEFSGAAVGVEGSGWAVLWKDKDGQLSVGQLEKHNMLGLNGMQPVLVLDVWEHAYYLDYLNDRKNYVEKWWQVVNWDDVAKRLS